MTTLLLEFGIANSLNNQWLYSFAIMLFFGGVLSIVQE